MIVPILSLKEAEMLELLLRHQEADNFNPTNIVLGVELKVTPRTASSLLRALRDKGLIQLGYPSKKSRVIEF